ncbi:hypothetical protein QJS10_CPB21g01609 [Acorus calamus]|uniref:Endonuclease/exonuclease/phosphatase domain-containing protein n=1 Tax=Acorus calamus TaxID=4465 RepID=A0AAV9C5D3_ACOCL|nr:hypothetical protein QJS10_CPB21g01609 [Acorus calamus]
MELLSFSNQYIHCKIIPAKGDIPSYFITVIYASNSSNERNSLWGDLEILAGSANLSKWMVGEDFNEVRYAHEKLGGCPPHIRSLSRFNNCIEACHLQDLWGSDSSFSWCNNKDARIASKLDHVLVNLQWMLEHTDSFYYALPPGLSDHSALQVTVCPAFISGPKPFKCFSAWEAHPQFEQVIRHAWDRSF